MTKAKEFEARMVDILNAGAMNLAMGIGYRLRLFDVMEAIGRPAPVREIAEQANLNHRYVREWLGIMSTGRVVEIVKGEAYPLYYLPPEHARILTRRSGSANLGVYAQEIPMLTESALGAVVRGFDTGEGVPFSVYPEFQAFMSELSCAKHQEVLVDRFLPLVDDGRLFKRLESGIRVCDLGCGEGVALNLMARRFPASEFIGIDNHGQALETAAKAARDGGLSNAGYLLSDASRLDDREDLAGAFDYICAFDAIHDQARPLEALRCVRAMLAPGGLFSMVDIDAASDHQGNLDHPMGPFLYTVSLMHCMPVGLADGGAGLGMMWGRDRAVSLLREAGFEAVEVQEMPHDPFNIHYCCRKVGQ